MLSAEDLAARGVEPVSSPYPLDVITDVDLGRVPVRALNVPNQTADFQVYVGKMLLLGWSLMCTGSAALQCLMFDGTKDTDAACGAISGTNQTATTVSLPKPGVLIRSGLFLDIDAGGLQGAFFYIPLG